MLYFTQKGGTTMKKENTSIRLRQLMADRGLKQVDILNLAEPICKRYNVKMNKSDISQYVSGKVEPNQSKLFVLSECLGVNVAWLMGYDVPMERTPIILGSELEKIFNKISCELNLPKAYLTNLFFSANLEGISEKRLILNEENIRYIIKRQLGPSVSVSPKIMDYYESLNNSGKQEATKRVKELTYIPQYTTKEFLNAAHAIDGASDEDKQHDEDIMNDENF